MKLFSMPGTCAVSVAIVLQWIGRPFELVLMGHGQNRRPDYLAINPSGQVPALQLDDGRVLTEAAAILPYLASVHPEARLGPGDDPDEAFRLARMMSYLTSELHVAFKPHFTPQRFLANPDQFPALRARAWEILGPMLEGLDATLGSQPFLLGGRRTVADAYLHVILRWVDEGPDGIAPYPALARFRAEAERDPDVRRALADHGMPPLAPS